MTTIYIQWADDSRTTIVSVFAVPQDPDHFPRHDEITSADPRYKAWFDSLADWQSSALIQPDSATTPG